MRIHLFACHRHIIPHFRSNRLDPVCDYLTSLACSCEMLPGAPIPLGLTPAKKRPKESGVGRRRLVRKRQIQRECSGNALFLCINHKGHFLGGGAGGGGIHHAEERSKHGGFSMVIPGKRSLVSDCTRATGKPSTLQRLSRAYSGRPLAATSLLLIKDKDNRSDKNSQG
jgi:hypothetical protein